MNKIGYIYKITNPNGGIYIGQTTNPEVRFKYYRLLHCKRQIKIYRSLVKYGWENHTIEIIDSILYDKAELNKLEESYVAKYNSNNYETGLNLTPGGTRLSDLNKKINKERSTGRKVSEETKEKLRQANLGKKQSPETVAKRNAVNTGKKRTDESRRKMSESRMGMKFSDSHRESLRNVKREPYSAERREKNRIVFARARAAGKMRKRVKGRIVISLIDNKEFISIKLACAYYGLEYDKTKSILNGHGYGTTFLRVAS